METRYYFYGAKKKSAGALPRGSHKPYRWYPPRSRRGRDRAAMEAAGLTHMKLAALTLKGLYPAAPNDSGCKPAWAELSYDRGWMTLTEYLMTPNEPGPNPLDSLNESQFFGLVPKRKCDDA